MRRGLIAALLVLVLLSPFIATGEASGDEADVVIELTSPRPGTAATNTTPLIVILYEAPSGIDLSSVQMTVDDLDVITYEMAEVTETGVRYQVLHYFELLDGDHIIQISVSDNDGTTRSETFIITIDTSVTEDEEDASMLLRDIAMAAIVITIIAAAAFVVVYLVLRQTRDFQFRRFFAQRPVPKGLPVKVMPAVAAAYFVLFGFAFLGGPEQSPFLTEYIIIIAIFIALGPYAVYAQIDKRKIAAYERAFSQFLYEMADAMRGGIDPAKAVTELAKTDNGVLAKHLRIASNGIDMGRPFEEMINVMVKDIDSKLVKRYASLIGESAKVGGEIALVVHRAAKDMDDLIKIEEERGQNLSVQATTIYIAFGVLLIVVYLLIWLYPSLASSDMSIMGGSSYVQKMDLETLQRRFLHLTVVNSLGSGILVGMFTTGKLKYGLLHALILVITTVAFFMISIL